MLRVKTSYHSTSVRSRSHTPVEGLCPAELCTRKLRTVGRSRFWTDSGLLGQRGIHSSTEMATRKDTGHIRGLLLSSPCIQLPNFSKGTELWVLLHQKRLTAVAEPLCSSGSVYQNSSYQSHSSGPSILCSSKQDLDHDCPIRLCHQATPQGPTKNASPPGWRRLESTTSVGPKANSFAFPHPPPPEDST